MTIYSKNYRSVYKEFNGPIPKEENGRSYDIHHIDGNHANNNPKNLVAVTLQEHYDIHYAQGDYGACQAILIRMESSHDQISTFAKLAMEDRVRNGTNHHNRPEYKQKISDLQISKVREGTHHTQTLEWKESCSKREQKKLSSGNHPFIGENAKKIKRKTGKDHPRFNPTLYTFQHIHTGEIVTSTVLDFTKSHNIIRGNLDQLIAGKGRRKSVSGWRLLVVPESNESRKTE